MSGGRALDQEGRDRIRADLGSNIFVDAGAGSGKTAALVGRVMELVASGRAELANIAAITFTEKAAEELRSRIRQKLEEAARCDPGSARGRRCAVALRQLDGAAIGTLHSFALRICSEHPIEAGLPPRVDVLDEVSSDVAFEQAWSRFQDALLENPTIERSLLLLFAAGVAPEALRKMARAFRDNWDLVESSVPAVVAEPPRVHALLEPARQILDELAAIPCAKPGDRLKEHIDRAAQWVGDLLATRDELAVMDALHPDAPAKAPSFKVASAGSDRAWGDAPAVRSRVAEAGRIVAGVRAQVIDACARHVASRIRGFTLGEARRRQASGRLQFQDLLVLARAMLRDGTVGPAVRQALHDRYQHILLDEGQDTDPIQVELAVRIAADDPASADAGAPGWQEVALSPGRLFMVGDPKQSIYRFRRADVATFLAAGELFRRSGGSVTLSRCFRSTQPIVDWVNKVFGRLMGEAPEVPVPERSRPSYVELEADRQAAPHGPAVSVLGRTEHRSDQDAGSMRAAEASEVAAVVATILADGWKVDDHGTRWRDATPGDIAVLLPSRTSLPYLEEALEAAGLPYRVESSFLVYASRPVRDLLMVLRAADDPSNELHVVSALRTPLLACGDDDLFRFRHEHKGHWRALDDQPASVPDDDPVRAGLAYLRRIHEERHWASPGELLARVARERRAFELGFAERRPRDVWRRLRFAIDQARAWSDATDLGLRQYLAWVDRQAEEQARLGEAVLPETDDDAVRIMTIHAAKGLEFPVTILSGMSSVPRRPGPSSGVQFTPQGKVVYLFGGSTPEGAEWAASERQMDLDERVRLLYVACTRARDHLVVSLHRKAATAPVTGAQRTNAQLIVDGMGGDLSGVADPWEAGPKRADLGGTTGSPLPPGGSPAGDVSPAGSPGSAGAATAPQRLAPQPASPGQAPPPIEPWRSEREEALRRAGEPQTLAATTLGRIATSAPGGNDTSVDRLPGEEAAAGLLKDPPDLDELPWLKGRYGTALGRAVHGALQAVDLATGDGLGAAIAAQCEAEAVLEVGDVERRVRAALGSPTVREAAARAYWREMYVCAPVEGRLIEGYIDLAFRGPSGLVVVDYKTSNSFDPAQLDRCARIYRAQGAAYALALRCAVGERVARVVFVFLTPKGAVERELDDLAGALGEVRAMLRSGAAPATLAGEVQPI